MSTLTRLSNYEHWKPPSTRKPVAGGGSIIKNHKVCWSNHVFPHLQAEKPCYDVPASFHPWNHRLKDMWKVMINLYYTPLCPTLQVHLLISNKAKEGASVCVLCLKHIYHFLYDEPTMFLCSYDSLTPPLTMDSRICFVICFLHAQAPWTIALRWVLTAAWSRRLPWHLAGQWN